jgi:hypothetical protein
VIVSENKNKLEEHLLPLNDALSQIQSSYASVHNAEEALKKQVQDAEQSINESFDVLFAALKNRKETLLKALKQSSDIEQNKIQVERSTLAIKEKQLSSSVKLVESVLANYSPEELIGSCKTLKVYLEKRLSNFRSLNLAITERNVKLSVDNKCLLSQINHFGGIESYCDRSTTPTITMIVDSADKQITQERIQCTLLYSKADQYILSFTAPYPKGVYQLRIPSFTMHSRLKPYRDYCQIVHPFHCYKVQDKPQDICCLLNGITYVLFSTSIFIYNKSGRLVSCLERNTADDTAIFKKSNQAIAAKENILYVANDGEGKIMQLNNSGTLIKTFGRASNQSRLVISEEDNVYVTFINSIDVYTAQGILVKSIDCCRGITGIALDLSLNIHVTLTENGSVLVYSPNGSYIRNYGNRASKPHCIVIDEDGYCLISEFKKDGQILIFNPKGKFVKSVGAIDFSTGLSIDTNSCIHVISSTRKAVYIF